jgi:ABC-2 type transport system ATP-binding protein
MRSYAATRGINPTPAKHCVPKDDVTAAIEIDGLTKRYGGRAVVQDLTLSVGAGQVLALLGRNGAGKTTTVECATGFRSPDAGTVRVLGADPVRQRAAVTPKLGVMLQEGGAYQAATPREMLELYAALYPTPRGVDEMLELVDLAARASDRFRTLSGGEKQRVNLALALIGQPQVVFLDEPTAGMDPAARRRTWDVITQLRADGAAVLLTTHYLEEAERLADAVAIIEDGRLLAHDTPRTLVSDGGAIVVTCVDPVDVDALQAEIGAPARQDGADRYVIAAGADRVADVTAWFAAQGLTVAAVTTQQRTLEDVYLSLTGQERP